MKQYRTFFLMIGVVLIEIALVYGMFFFVSAMKPAYVFTALALIAAGIFYLIYSRYREKIKVKSKADVRKSYLRIVLIAASAVALSLASAIVVRALVFLIRGA